MGNYIWTGTTTTNNIQLFHPDGTVFDDAETFAYWEEYCWLSNPEHREATYWGGANG